MAYVQSNFGTGADGSGNIKTTFTLAQTAGNLIVVGIWLYPDGSVVNSVSDVSGNTYHLAYNLSDGGEGINDHFYYAYNIAAATANVNIVTVNESTINQSYAYIGVIEESGIQSTSDPLRVANGVTGESLFQQYLLQEP